MDQQAPKELLLTYYMLARQTFGLVDIGRTIRGRLKLGPRITLEDVIIHHLEMMKKPFEEITEDDIRSHIQKLLTEEERKRPFS